MGEPDDAPPRLAFIAALHRATTDREGEVTLVLKVPASDSPLVTQAFLLLRETALRVTLEPAE